MREIKFRAWDKDYKGYCCGVDIGNLLTGLAYNNGDKSEIVKDKVLAEHFILEQYTGLKDKNGKEIYEGDIVQIDSMDEIRVGYVELVADQYCIVCGEDEEGNKIVAEFYYYSKPEENCKVIGNIHENPELSEGKE